jgi:hypothetical protein
MRSPSLPGMILLGASALAAPDRTAAGPVASEVTTAPIELRARPGGRSPGAGTAHRHHRTTGPSGTVGLVVTGRAAGDEMTASPRRRAPSVSHSTPPGKWGPTRRRDRARREKERQSSPSPSSARRWSRPLRTARTRSPPAVTIALQRLRQGLTAQPISRPATRRSPARHAGTAGGQAPARCRHSEGDAQGLQARARFSSGPRVGRARPAWTMATRRGGESARLRARGGHREKASIAPRSTIRQAGRLDGRGARRAAGAIRHEHVGVVRKVPGGVVAQGQSGHDVSAEAFAMAESIKLAGARASGPQGDPRPRIRPRSDRVSDRSSSPSTAKFEGRSGHDSWASRSPVRRRAVVQVHHHARLAPLMYQGTAAKSR